MRPSVPAADVLALLHRVDAGRLRVRLESEYRTLRSYRTRSGWALIVLALDGEWCALESFAPPRGPRQDPWHHLYDPDHRVDAAYYAEVRDWRPEHPERYGLAAAKKRRAFAIRPRRTKNGRRAFC